MNASSTKKKKRKDGKKKIEEPPPFQLRSTSFADGLSSVVTWLQGKKNIVVLTGAGISVSCGIPDFRSKGIGLYSTLDLDALNLSCPEELFDWDFFQENPVPFFQFARNLYFPLGSNEKVRPSDSHKLLAMLEQKKMLLRVYSQNIDGLEQVAGVSPKRIVYAHGSLQWATCCKCKRKVSAAEIEPDILKGATPYCQAPVVVNGNHSSPIAVRNGSRSRKRKDAPGSATLSRCSSSSSGGNVCGGILKPGITFFGEQLGDNVTRCLEVDRKKVDALVVIGTSLSVSPISKVIDYFPAKIPRILINRAIVHPPKAASDTEVENGDNQERDFRQDHVFDAYLLGFCDDVTRALAKLLFSGENTSVAVADTHGKILSTLTDENDEFFKLQDWTTVKVPKERVFLFPGAQPPTKDDYNQDDDDASELTYKEIAHCDGCSKRIHGVIRKCVDCFDYDLCQACFPKLSKTHFDGTHEFSNEIAAAVSPS